uniref:hypothetical protein n=1 Tax=uncultured Draconibacterium sp. TaxID=1573823 RepID=UPI003216E1A7
MKTKKIKRLKIYFLLLTFCMLFFGAGCSDDENEYSGFVEGYVVGSFAVEKVNEEGLAAGNKTERGYCILLEESENNSMDFYTFNFPDNLFSFSDEIFTTNSLGYGCGPDFFPDSLKYAYKIKFRYRIVNEPYEKQFAIACNHLFLSFPWENYDQINLNETTID